MFVTTLFTLLQSSLSRAEDSVFKELFVDSLYGAFSGALIGGAIMVFKDRPLDHLDYMGYGAAAGVLAGASYGSYKIGKALAQVENGKVRFAIPAVIPDFIDGTSSKGSSVTLTADLISGQF
jgi:hypothetical protein